MRSILEIDPKEIIKISHEDRSVHCNNKMSGVNEMSHSRRQVITYTIL